MKLIIKTTKGFVNENGKFVKEYPDAAIFKTLDTAKFVADTVFHLQNLDAEVIENYGLENEKVVYSTPSEEYKEHFEIKSN